MGVPSSTASWRPYLSVVDPQTVTRRGEPVVVVVAIDTWRRVAGPVPSLKSFLRSAPLDGVDTSRDSGDRPDVALP
jgi:antitoxin (DNA-binding transcriptional repressor) of toxin-antitoxin stability system